MNFPAEVGLMMERETDTEQYRTTMMLIEKRNRRISLLD